MIFHENRLLADDSYEISYLFFRKFEKMSQNLLSAAVVIGALRAKTYVVSAQKSCLNEMALLHTQNKC